MYQNVFQLSLSTRRRSYYYKRNARTGVVRDEEGFGHLLAVTPVYATAVPIHILIYPLRPSSRTNRDRPLMLLFTAVIVFSGHFISATRVHLDGND